MSLQEILNPPLSFSLGIYFGTETIFPLIPKNIKYNINYTKTIKCAYVAPA